MSHSKPQREFKKRNVSQPAPELSPVAQAIQRSQHDVLPGERRAMQNHPVQRAVSLLKALADGELLTEDDEVSARGASEGLEDYHNQQVQALEIAGQRADTAERAHSAFMAEVALTLDLPEATKAEDILAALRERVREPLTGDVDALPVKLQQDDTTLHMQAVCRVLAKHFADDPAVTFANAAGLVQHLIDDGNSAAVQFANERDRADKLLATLRQEQEQEKGQQVGEQQIPVSALRKLVQEFNGGLVDYPLDALRDMLQTLQANQQPEGWQHNVDVLVKSNKRYEAMLATIQNVISLA